MSEFTLAEMIEFFDDFLCSIKKPQFSNVGMIYPPRASTLPYDRKPTHSYVEVASQNNGYMTFFAEAYVLNGKDVLATGASLDARLFSDDSQRFRLYSDFVASLPLETEDKEFKAIEKVILFTDSGGKGYFRQPPHRIFCFTYKRNFAQHEVLWDGYNGSYDFGKGALRQNGRVPKEEYIEFMRANFQRVHGFAGHIMPV